MASRHISPQSLPVVILHIPSSGQNLELQEEDRSQDSLESRISLAPAPPYLLSGYVLLSLERSRNRRADFSLRNLILTASDPIIHLVGHLSP